LLVSSASALLYFDPGAISNSREAITKAIAGAVAANGTAEDPQGYAEKFAHRIFPNMLPYEVGTPAVFGFVEWNGRSLTDNAPNVMFSIAANAPVSLGLGKESVGSKPSKTFPYVPAAPPEKWSAPA
jgi:hypothetical protein